MNTEQYNHFPVRIMITGCRYLTSPASRELVYWFMDKLRASAKVAFQIADGEMIWGVGDCPNGPDAFAWKYLKEYCLNRKRFIADWDRYGKYAGPTRNNLMVATIKPTHTLAFMHPKAKGTVGCANRAQPISRVYRIYAPGVYTSTAAGEPVPPPFDWSTLA